MDVNVRGPVSKVLLTIMRIVAYIIQPVLFFLWMSINNPQLLKLNRTSIVTFFLFSTLQLVFLKIYGGYAIGKKKNKPIIYNMSLSVFLTSLAAYTQLQIMNVNAFNNKPFVFFGPDFLLFILALLSQILILTFLVKLGNNLYFTLYPPKKSCIITADNTNYANIVKKLERFKLQYCVCEHIDYKENYKPVIDRTEVAFLFDVPTEIKSSIVEYCYKAGTEVYYVPSIYDIIVNGSRKNIIDDIPFLSGERKRTTFIQKGIKRLFDLLLVIPVLLLVSPLLLLLAVVIKLSDGGPVIYKQERLTLGGKTFNTYKFRSMIVDAEKDGVPRLANVNDERITRIGAFMRRFRLDEFPQLFNILRGDMSWVGPRPERPQIAEQYEQFLPEFKLRLRVKAGLTGYAQVYGKYNTPPQEKLLMDLFYIENQTEWLDICLLFKTLAVLFRKDATEAVAVDDVQVN